MLEASLVAVMFLAGWRICSGIADIRRERKRWKYEQLVKAKALLAGYEVTDISWTGDNGLLVELRKEQP